ncbi:MAG: hypothetical protein U0930_04875 [Pirellulales bacterium]
MNSGQWSFVANADISPSRFVQVYGGPHQVKQCAAGGPAFGVSHEGTVDPPIPLVSTALAAKQGESVMVYGPGDTCEIECGAAISLATGPVYLKADAQGRAIPAVATDKYYAEAVSETSAAGEKVKAIIVRGVA